jgi:hypothetical protein
MLHRHLANQIPYPPRHLAPPYPLAVLGYPDEVHFEIVLAVVTLSITSPTRLYNTSLRLKARDF